MIPGAFRIRAACATLLVLASLAGAPPADAGPRALLDRALKGTRDARTTFRQVRTDPLGTTVTQGRLEYRRPRQVRLEWLGTVASTAIVNGDTVWFYQPSQKSVLKGSAAAGGAPPALFLEESVASIERAYRIEEQGSLGLTLTPRSARSPWVRLTLALDAATGWPKNLVLTSQDGTTTRLEFARFRVNEGASAARFTPKFPAGTTVVDL